MSALLRLWADSITRLSLWIERLVAGGDGAAATPRKHAVPREGQRDARRHDES